MHVVRAGGQFSSGKRRFYRRRGSVYAIIGLFLLAIPISVGLAWGGVAGIVFLIVGVKHFLVANCWEKGIVGEELVVQALTSLDNAYVLINDVMLPKRRGNIDHILVGPNGAFAIETKSYRWHPLNRFPIRQAIRNAISLRQFLKEHGHGDLFVQAVLVSTDPRARTKGRFSTVHVSPLDGLCDIIAGIQKGVAISPDYQRRIVHEILGSQS